MFRGAKRLQRAFACTSSVVREIGDTTIPLFGASDIPGFNKAVFAALKPGGTFIVIDYAAAAGSGLTATGTLHRIDPEVVKKEVTAAGFTFVGASDVLHRTNDDMTTRRSDTVEQFTFKFKKP